MPLYIDFIRKPKNIIANACGLEECWRCNILAKCDACSHEIHHQHIAGPETAPGAAINYDDGEEHLICYEYMK